MSFDNSGGPSSRYPQSRSQDNQQGYRPDQEHPDNRSYADNASHSAQPVGQQRANHLPNGPRSPSYSRSDPGRAVPDAWAQAEQSKALASKRLRWLIPVIVVVLLLIVGGVVYAVGQNALQEPMNAANAFCNDLKAQKYSDAYSLLSSGYQARVSGKDFAEIGQLHDQIDGKVKQCGLAGLQNTGGFTLNLNPQSASLNAQIIRKETYTGTVTLVKQNGNWKIDAVADALQGSDVGALTTAQLFCQGLANQNYTEVYGMFTPAYQQQIGSAASYANGLKQVFGGGQFQITGCQPNLATFTVTAQDDAASVSGALNIKVTTDAGALTVPVPFKMAFAKVSGAWKISDLQVVQSQG